MSYRDALTDTKRGAAHLSYLRVYSFLAQFSFIYKIYNAENRTNSLHLLPNGVKFAQRYTRATSLRRLSILRSVHSSKMNVSYNRGSLTFNSAITAFVYPRTLQYQRYFDLYPLIVLLRRKLIVPLYPQ